MNTIVLSALLAGNAQRLVSKQDESVVNLAIKYLVAYGKQENNLPAKKHSFKLRFQPKLLRVFMERLMAREFQTKCKRDYSEKHAHSILDITLLFQLENWSLTIM